jgi:hypothetical protein
MTASAPKLYTMRKPQSDCTKVRSCHRARLKSRFGDWQQVFLIGVPEATQDAESQPFGAVARAAPIRSLIPSITRAAVR